MSWRSNLRPAQLGSARFHTTDRKFSGGHRIKNHEFPKRDSNFPEEMGHKTRRWSIDAYCIGDDYMGLRDALIAACERHGPQQYTDHWGRSGLVLCETWDLTETSHDGRFCKFSLSFINAGGGAMPVAALATATLVGIAAQSLTAASLAGFASAFKK